MTDNETLARVHDILARAVDEFAVVITVLVPRDDRDATLDRLKALAAEHLDDLECEVAAEPIWSPQQVRDARAEWAKGKP